jgi:hypothetical protein
LPNVSEVNGEAGASFAPASLFMPITDCRSRQRLPGRPQTTTGVFVSSYPIANFVIPQDTYKEADGLNHDKSQNDYSSEGVDNVPSGTEFPYRASLLPEQVR